jgi:hypothetical protein
MKIEAVKAQRMIVKVLSRLLVLAALDVVDAAGDVKPVPGGSEPDEEVTAEEPDIELGRVVLVPLIPGIVVPEPELALPEPDWYIGGIPVAGITVVTPPELSMTDIGIKSVEYCVEIADTDPDPEAEGPPDAVLVVPPVLPVLEPITVPESADDASLFPVEELTIGATVVEPLITTVTELGPRDDSIGMDDTVLEPDSGPVTTVSVARVEVLVSAGSAETGVEVPGVVVPGTLGLLVVPGVAVWEVVGELLEVSEVLTADSAFAGSTGC